MSSLSRSMITPEAVLQSLVATVRTALQLGDRSCWATVDAMVPLGAIPPGGDIFATVVLGDIEFGFDQTEPDNLFAQTTAIVTIYTRFALDDMGHDEGLLLHDTRGLYANCRTVINAIHGRELLTEFDELWCASLPKCTSMSRADYNQELLIGWMSLQFSIAWDFRNE